MRSFVFLVPPLSFCINHQRARQDVKCPTAALIWNLSAVTIWLCKARGTAVAERLHKESNPVTIMLSRSSWETVGVEGEWGRCWLLNSPLGNRVHHRLPGVSVYKCDEGRCWRGKWVCTPVRGKSQSSIQLQTAVLSFKHTGHYSFDWLIHLDSFSNFTQKEREREKKLGSINIVPGVKSSDI